ncbi:MAG: UDP-N-acetylglucosamine--N-acetylmuramyl-(pentapeptide) pyrophosphoryl-undecaprenol N-acetylglucosamine transferase [Pseudohongiellaceae bacterium]|jgi:UDP-N-acetylglucosamine--N-acetylmuramyl-(pentapeptide) pyrophosphoryl-undecaprenol N-acetylglucosamine transferase
MRVAYLGGGTGGHLAPGIGVSEALGDAADDSLFLVAGRSVERAMLEPRQLPFVELFGDRGRPAPWRVDLWARATTRLTRALTQFDPDVLVVLGGWVALPALWLAALPGVPRRPMVLVEPNAVPGKVGRWLDGRVDFTCLARSGDAMPRGRQATAVTGVPGPLLKSWSREAAAALFGLDPQRRTLLVTGGSQGARDVNRLVPGVIDLLAAESEPWQVLHVVGPGPAVDPSSESRCVPVSRVTFVDDMSPAWALADLALCRAGSGTCCELQASATPAVLVPYPHHRDRHQSANGESLVGRGAAFMVGADDPTGARTVMSLIGRALGGLPQMTAAAFAQSRADPAKSVAAVVRRASLRGEQNAAHGA